MQHHPQHSSGHMSSEAAKPGKLKPNRLVQGKHFNPVIDALGEMNLEPLGGMHLVAYRTICRGRVFGVIGIGHYKVSIYDGGSASKTDTGDLTSADFGSIDFTKPNGVLEARWEVALGTNTLEIGSEISCIYIGHLENSQVPKFECLGAGGGSSPRGQYAGDIFQMVADNETGWGPLTAQQPLDNP